MNRDYFKWIVATAIVCVGIVGLFMWREKIRKAVPIPRHSVPGQFSPFKSYISAVGIVEASTGNINIGSPVNRVVDKIEVKVGQKVKEGDVLFRLESHDLQADLAGRRADYENAEANLHKLLALPRKEDIDSANAQLKVASAALEEAKGQYQRVLGLSKGALSDEEIRRRRFAFEQAEARFNEAQSRMEKTKSGAWAPDLEIAKLQVKQSLATLQRAEADLERTIIKAPTDATVLQIKIHEGEFPPSDSSRPAMVIGNIDTMNLRVSINQYDASFFDAKAPAVAYVQGNSTISFPLHFVHLEPYFVAKQNLSNNITEKVDTRVLQAIYCFEEGESRVYVGQQMDVFIDTNFTPKDGK